MSQLGQMVHTNHKHVPVKSDGANASQTSHLGCSIDGDLTLIVQLYNKMQHSQSLKIIFRLQDKKEDVRFENAHDTSVSKHLSPDYQNVGINSSRMGTKDQTHCCVFPLYINLLKPTDCVMLQPV